MPLKLTEFFAIPTNKRSTNDYEAMFDDFIKSAGGCRISDKYEIPQGKQNADYYFDLNSNEVIVELKQITRYTQHNTVDNYFSKLLQKGKVKNFDKLPDGKIGITPASLTDREWDRFYRKFCPAVESGLRKAANQLKNTISIIPSSDRKQFKGVVFLNSGNFNLPTDLLSQFVERKVKFEWKRGNFKSIDFVNCFTVDMYTSKGHPLNSRIIVRSTKDAELVRTAFYLQESWCSYFATSFGMTIEKIETEQSQDLELQLSHPFEGKIRYVKTS